MTKPYDDSNWREEYKSYVSNKKKLKLLEDGPHSLAQAWLLGAMYSDWKKIKGYEKNKGSRKKIRGYEKT